MGKAKREPPIFPRKLSLCWRNHLAKANMCSPLVTWPCRRATRWRPILADKHVDLALWNKSPAYFAGFLDDATRLGQHLGGDGTFRLRQRWHLEQFMNASCGRWWARFVELPHLRDPRLLEHALGRQRPSTPNRMLSLCGARRQIHRHALTHLQEHGHTTHHDSVQNPSADSKVVLREALERRVADSAGPS